MAKITFEKALFEPTLKQFGFGLNTKCFISYLYNPDYEGGFKDFKNQIKTLGYTDTQAKVYAVMLLNYKLNGSFVNWGINNADVPWYKRVKRARAILVVGNIEDRKQMMANWVSRVKPITFKKYEDTLNALDQKVIELKELFPSKKPNLPVSAEVKQLTLAQVEAILGYKVQLIA